MKPETTVTCFEGIAVAEVYCYDPYTNSSPLHREEGEASDVEHHEAVGNLCDCEGAVRHEFVPVNQHYHRDVLRRLREAIAPKTFALMAEPGLVDPS